MTIRWGIVGCGNVCEVKSGPGFQQARGSELVAVMRRDAGKAEDFAHRHGVPRHYSRVEDLIHDPEVNAVYIATPPGTHLEYSLMAARAGKPCYVEKPMARSFTECQRMLESFREARVPLFVAYYRRALPRFLKAKEVLDTGRLGEVYRLNYKLSRPLDEFTSDALPWRLQAAQSGGGLFLDLASHTLDIFDFLFGPLQEVRGTASNRGGSYEVEDTVSMTFRLSSGAEGSATWDFAAGASEDSIQVVGTQGELSLSCFGSEELRLEIGGTVEGLPGQNPPTVHGPLIQSIVDELLGQGQSSSTGYSAARTSRVMDIVLDGYYGGREDDFWNRPQSWPGRRASTRK
jgi:predicted dehydrogenase